MSDSNNTTTTTTPATTPPTYACNKPATNNPAPAATATAQTTRPVSPKSGRRQQLRKQN